MKTTLDNYFRQYLDYLQYQRHYADKTIESYKRQIDHFKQFLIEESIDDYNDVSYAMLRGYPVSYTHLDVYKRQSYNCNLY